VPTLLQWKSNKYYIFWECVCSLSYPACNAHAPYCHLWPAPLHNIFPHYFIKGNFPEKNVIVYKMCVLISVTTFVRRISHSKKKWARFGKKCKRSSCKVPLLFLSDFNAISIFWPVHRKIFKYQIYKKSVQ